MLPPRTRSDSDAPELPKPTPLAEIASRGGLIYTDRLKTNVVRSRAMPSVPSDNRSAEADPLQAIPCRSRPDEQPIRLVVGRRIAPPRGRIPDAAARAAMTANARYRTRVPKGIFFYANAAEMNRDRERWTVELMLARRAHRSLRD